MEQPKFNVGDFVEYLARDSERYKGRFYVTESCIMQNEDKTGDVWNGMCYKTPWKSWAGSWGWAREHDLRKVNPDGDELSSYSFDELISSIENTENV